MNRITRSWSQAGQDAFVHHMLVEGMNIKKGKFLDVGCSQPYIDNNTYHLEELGWRGLLVDIYDVAADPTHKIRERRSSPFVCADATLLDWTQTLLENNVIEKNTLNSVCVDIDYLSFDIDGGTVKGVENFPWEKFRFKIITIEHDVYSGDTDKKTVIENTLETHNYMLVCENVKHEGKKFENWYVDPCQVPDSLWSDYLCKDSEYTDIVPVIKNEHMNIFTY
jgi:hypothetical protein